MYLAEIHIALWNTWLKILYTLKIGLTELSLIEFIEYILNYYLTNIITKPEGNDTELELE